MWIIGCRVATRSSTEVQLEYDIFYVVIRRVFSESLVEPIASGGDVHKCGKEGVYHVLNV